MWLTDIAIKRPVFITVVFIALFVVGYRSLLLMPVDLFPKVDIPVVSVTTLYPGAGPEDIETLITKPIEDQVNTINKVDEIISVSRDSMSVVIIRFLIEADLDVAAADVRDKIDLAKPNLPDDAEDPTISKLDLGAIPVIKLGITSNNMNIREVKTLTKQILSDRLSKLSGVGSVQISGGDTREILVEADQDRLKACSMTIEDLRQILAAANRNIPCGSIKHGNMENSIKLQGEFENVDEIKNLRITKKIKDKTEHFLLSDLAKVTDGSADRDTFTRLDQIDSVGMVIRKQADANTLKVVELVRKELDSIKKDYPHLTIKISDDQSIFIKQSLDDVRDELIIGGLLAVFIVFLFLNEFRSTFIISTSLPTSMMSTFIILYAAGQSLNMMSLMGLALSSGILIDDSIVVIENIHRHLKKGKEPRQAALDGRSEIGLAAIAITMVDVVVYLPIAFMGGIVGRFFFSFGITVATATMFSLLVSFTLTPMLASIWFKKEEHPLLKKYKERTFLLKAMGKVTGTLPYALSLEKCYSEATREKEPHMLGIIFKSLDNISKKFFKHFNDFYDYMDQFYRGVLDRALKVRWLVVSIGMGSLVLTLMFIAPKIGFEFMPTADKGKITINLELPSDSNVDETDRFIKQIEEIISNKKDFPEVTSMFTEVGAEPGSIIGTGNQGPQYAAITIDVGDKKTRTRDVKDIGQEIIEKLVDVPYRITVTYPGGVGGGATESPVQIEITGNKFQMKDIMALSENIQKITENTKGAVDVDTSWKMGSPETRPVMDRVKIATMGLSATGIGAILRTSIEGNTDIKYREFGEQYDIHVRLQEKDRKEPLQINDIYLGHINDKPVYIKNIAALKTMPAPNKIDHRNKLRAIIISANLAKGAPLGNIKQAIEKEIAKMNIPAGITVKFGGEGKRMVESFGFMIQALILAIILVYLVMCALFESYLNPFIIMFALPQAMVGALLALFLTKTTLNIMSMIGIIMLVGLVAKNAILLIDYTNTLRERGMKRDDAIKEAGPTRLRPIMMTTVAMVFGMLPIALGLGSGAEMRVPMSIAVIGGLILSTLLTLLVIPVVYAQFDDLMNFIRKLRQSITL